MTAAPDPSRCPLCGGDNACGAVQGTRNCWCFAAAIPAAALARVPEAARNAACLCARCAAGAEAATSDSDPARE